MTASRRALICMTVADTEALGARIGRAVQPGYLLSLEGPLGAGKTSLVRGIAAGIGADPLMVKSPTFVLHHIYPTDRLPLHHIDLYRLGPGASIQMLDIETQLEDGVVVVEWGEFASLDRWDPIRIAAGMDGPSGRTFTLLTRAPAGIRDAWDAPA